MHSLKLTAFGEPLQASTQPLPRPTGSEVLLRVRAAGVCHSDLHLTEGGYDLGGGERLSLSDRGVTLPRTLGHETAGEVVAWGPEVKELAEGELRLVYPWIGCGHCPACSDGRENHCSVAPQTLGVYRDGGYADHILVPHPRYLIDIGDIDPEQAAPLACAGLTAYSAVRKLRSVAARQPLVLIGAGGLGLMCLNLVAATGGVGAVVVDVDPAKRAAALAAGAIAAVDGQAPDAAEQVRRAVGAPIEAVIDFVGNPASAGLAFDLLVKGGRLIMIGLFGGRAPWSLPLIPMKALTVEGCYVGTLGELEELVELVRAGHVRPLPVDRRPLAQANSALADLEKGQVLGRVVLMP